MTSPTKLALIGAGGIAGVHISGILTHPHFVTCTAVAEPDETRRNNRITELGGKARGFGSWKTMLDEMGSEIDAVVICLPHHLHSPAILDACAAQKHVLCEKPMCTSLDDAQKIVEAVKNSGIIYMSAHNQLFLPAFQKARKLVRSGRVGDVLWIRSQDCFIARNWKSKDEGNWRADAKTQGGGELIDTGYHPTYRLLELANSKPVAIRGTMGRYNLAIDGEDTASVQVRFENGVMGEILTSWAMRRPHGTHEIHVVGTEGELFGTGGELYFLPHDCSAPAKVDVPHSDKNAGLFSFQQQIAEFGRCVRESSRPPHGPEEGLATLEIILRAAESAEGWQSTTKRS